MLFVKSIINDLMHGTSHSVKSLLENDVERTISKGGIKIRKLLAGLLSDTYRI